MAAQWLVQDSEGTLVGHLTSFSVRGGEPHFVVRDLWHQDLGMVDTHGRAYRYLPHQKKPSWLGTGTVLQGVQLILGTSDLSLVEVIEAIAPR